MCQLTFCKFSTSAHTELYTTMSLISNTFVTHHDGWGIFGGGKVFKTYMNAQLTSDIGKLVHDYHVEKSPIISHVRLSSIGTKVATENSHPFETDNFILMHNGTLGIKEEFKVQIEEIKKKINAKIDIIDSEIFTFALENEFNRVKDVPKALINTMSMFCGKFAFIIYCKPENVYYIVRGKTAELYFSVFSIDKKTIGLVVNTEKSAFERTVHLFENLLQTINVNITHTDIAEIEKESIFRYQANKLIKVGEIKEVEKETIPFYQWAGQKYQKKTFTESGVAESSMIKQVSDFMNLYYLSIEDVDKLLFFTIGKGILTVDKNDMKAFLHRIANRLTVKHKFRANILKILEETKLSFIPISFYTKYSYQFPYMLIKNRADQDKFLISLRLYLKELYA